MLPLASSDLLDDLDVVSAKPVRYMDETDWTATIRVYGALAQDLGNTGGMRLQIGSNVSLRPTRVGGYGLSLDRRRLRQAAGSRSRTRLAG